MKRGVTALSSLIALCVSAAGCAAESAASTPISDPTISAVTTSTEVATTPSSTLPASTTSTSTTVPRPLVYVFPFSGKKVSYGRRHHDYPATDVFGCGATIGAPIGGTVDETRTFDPWVPKVDDPATRGGKYVSMVGDDGVRYYFAHLDSVDVEPGQIVDGGTPLGIMGQTGNARKSICHTHFGISWPCDRADWAVRRGEIWPWKYLDAWRSGVQLSPVDEVRYAEAANPDACSLAVLTPGAADE